MGVAPTGTGGHEDGPSGRRGQAPAAVRLWIAALATVGVAAGSAATAVWSPSAAALPWSAWVLLGVALVLAGRLTIDVRHHGEIDSFDVFEAALTPVVFLLSGIEAVLLVAVAKTVAQLWLRMSGTKLAFNVAQWVACTGAGALVFAVTDAGGRVETRLPALVAAMVTVAVVNLGALTGLFALLGGATAVRQLLRATNLLWTAGLTVTTVGCGLAVTVAATDHPAALLVLVALPLLLNRVGRGYALANAELDRMRRLQSATRTLATVLDPREDVLPFLAETAHCCRAEAVYLTLRRGDGLDTRSFVASPGPGRPDESSGQLTLTALLLGADLPVHVLAQPRRTTRGRALAGPLRESGAPGTDGRLSEALRAAGWRDCLAVPVQIANHRVGVLAVYDRSGLSDLDPADLATLQNLAREVASALQRSHLVAEVLGARENGARIVQASKEGIAALDPSGAVVTWNPAMSELTGQPSDAMVGEHRIGLLDARDSDGRPVPLEHWHFGGPLPDELSVLTRSGRRRWLSVSYARTERDGSSGPQLVLMVRDVTELRHQRDLIAGQGKVLELVAADEPPARSLRAIATMVAGQLEGNAALVVPGLDPPLWISDDDTVADPDGSLLAAVLAVPTGRWIASAANGRPVLLERPYWAMPVLDPDQSRLWCVLLVRPNRGHGQFTRSNQFGQSSQLNQPNHFSQLNQLSPSGQSLLGHNPEPDGPALEVLRTAARLASVCLERDASRVRLAHQASHDPLTGLPNRLLFLDRCTHALAKAERSGGHAVVLFIDLDRFKVVNDSLGHDAGDRLLMAVGERLKEAVRPSDTIARFGGDEFTILCEELNADEDARVIADRVLALFATPFHLDGRDVFESASVGIALGTAPQRAEELVQHADAAMYRAKAGGGNRYEFFDERLRKQAEARLASYTGLRRAVDACEFEVFYQPTVGLDHGNPVGVEALARWRHPTRGLLPPSAFIDLAEETGLIVPLGTQILRSALQEMPHAIPDGADRPLRVAVNLSARQLTNPDLVTTVERALADAGVPPERLSLEITESMLLTDSAATRQAIAQLKRIGVDLSLDDFGTGHCSMDYLKFLPVDELKIERRFVTGLLTDHQDRAIVSAIISLAHDLGLRVVAEGVETLGQATRLREMGCDVGQGYFFGAPMPGNDVLSLTRRFTVPEAGTPAAGIAVPKAQAAELRAVRDIAG